MARAFISYSSENIAAARRLSADLKAAGLETWLAGDDLLPGQNWRNEIARAIRNSRYFIALLSKSSIEKRGFFHREFRQALEILDEFPENEIFLIPARLDDCQPSYERLRGLHWVDLFPDWAGGVSVMLTAMKIEDVEVASRSEKEIVRILASSFEVDELEMHFYEAGFPRERVNWKQALVYVAFEVIQVATEDGRLVELVEYLAQKRPARTDLQEMIATVKG